MAKSVFKLSFRARSRAAALLVRTTYIAIPRFARLQCEIGLQALIEGAQESCRAAGTLLRVLLQEPEDQSLHPRGKGRVHPPRWGGRGLPVGAQDQHRVLPGEGKEPRRQTVENDSQGVEIR